MEQILCIFCGKKAESLQGQLAEILGPQLISIDTFFRTLRLKQFGEVPIHKYINNFLKPL